MKYEITLGERKVAVDVRPERGGGYLITVDGGPPRFVNTARLGAAEWRLEEDGVSRSLGLYLDGDRVDAQVGGHAWRGRVVDPRRDALALGAGGAKGAVATPMPGAVVRVLVAVGDEVRLGQPVVVVEAMKMENEFKSPCVGTVAAVHVTAGTAVDAGALLVVITPADGA